MFWTEAMGNCDTLCVRDVTGGAVLEYNWVGVLGCTAVLNIESRRGGTGGGWSWSVLGGTCGGSEEDLLMNTSLLALLDVESRVFVFLRRGGNGGGGCRGGSSVSDTRETNSAVGTFALGDGDEVAPKIQ